MIFVTIVYVLLAHTEQQVQFLLLFFFAESWTHAVLFSYFVYIFFFVKKYCTFCECVAFIVDIFLPHVFPFLFLFSLYQLVLLCQFVRPLPSISFNLQRCSIRISMLRKNYNILHQQSFNSNRCFLALSFYVFCTPSIYSFIINGSYLNSALERYTHARVAKTHSI